MKCAVPTCSNTARPNRRTCSPACAALWHDVYRFRSPESLARFTTPEGRAKHRLSQARTTLKKPEKYGPTRTRWAQKVLAESEGIRS